MRQPKPKPQYSFAIIFPDRVEDSMGIFCQDESYSKIYAQASEKVLDVYPNALAALIYSTAGKQIVIKRKHFEQVRKVNANA